MTTALTLCDNDDGFAALSEAMTVLLRGVDLKVTGHLAQVASLEAHQTAWNTWLPAHQMATKQAIATTYQAAQAFEIPDIVEAARLLKPGAEALTEAIFESMDGARHQRLLNKVHTAWNAEPTGTMPPAMAFAIKGALFNISLPATQLIYFHYEWRASAGGLLRRDTASLEAFLQPTEHADLIRLEWPPSLDSQQPHSIFQRHG